MSVKLSAGKTASVKLGRFSCYFIRTGSGKENKKSKRRHTNVVRQKIKEDLMVKRKARFDAVEKHSKTPVKNLQETEFSPEFGNGENVMKGFNRNSQRGRKGKS